MSFKESWVIPKEKAVDYFHCMKNAENTVQDENEDEVTEQEGGASNQLLDNLMKEKPSKRIRLTKDYLNRSVPPPPQIPTSLPKNKFPAEKKSMINLGNILAYFPDAEKYKVTVVINYINSYLSQRIKVEPNTLNIILDNNYIWDSNITDILKFLFDIDRFYVSQYTIYQDPITKQRYGIPTGIKEMVKILKEKVPNGDLKILGFSHKRLKILNHVDITESNSVIESSSESEEDYGSEEDDDTGKSGHNTSSSMSYASALRDSAVEGAVGGVTAAPSPIPVGFSTPVDRGLSTPVTGFSRRNLTTPGIKYGYRGAENENASFSFSDPQSVVRSRRSLLPQHSRSSQLFQSFAQDTAPLEQVPEEEEEQEAAEGDTQSTRSYTHSNSDASDDEENKLDEAAGGLESNRNILDNVNDAMVEDWAKSKHQEKKEKKEQKKQNRSLKKKENKRRRTSQQILDSSLSSRPKSYPDTSFKMQTRTRDRKQEL